MNSYDKVYQILADGLQVGGKTVTLSVEQDQVLRRQTAALLASVIRPLESEANSLKGKLRQARRDRMQALIDAKYGKNPMERHKQRLVKLLDEAQEIVETLDLGDKSV